MPPLRPEHAFQRYRDHGDVAALGAVFDAVAPDLLLVAVRLAGVDAAEDLLQSTFVDAIEHAARWDAQRPLMPWLCGILANHARELRRRAGRALVSARLPERVASTPDDAAAATEVTAAVHAAVAALPADYRRVLTLRLLHGLELQRIAAVLGLPLGTVKAKVHRGTRLLRRTLPAGLATTLAAMLLPGSGLAAVRATVVARAAGRVSKTTAVFTTTAITVLVMKKLTLLLAAAAVAVGIWMWAGDDPSLPPPRTGAPVASNVPAALASTGEPDVAERRAAATATNTATFDAIPAHASLARATVNGRVVDVAGVGVGGIELVVLRGSDDHLGPDLGLPRTAGSPAPVAVADAIGHFTLTAIQPFRVRVRDDDYVTVLEGVAGDKASEMLVVVARRIALGGVVADTAGNPIAGARVSVAAQVQLAGLDQSASRLLIPETRTDARGQFRIADAAAVPDAQLQFEAPGFATRIDRVPDGGDPGLSIVLSRTADGIGRITGRVVLADGSPAPGALVSTGGLAAAADAQGLFVIELEPWLTTVDETIPTVLTAVRRGLRPATQQLPPVQQARARGWPTDIVLRLADAPLVIAGTVVDEIGEPVVDALVELATATPFGFVPMPGIPALAGVPRTLEEIAGGGDTYSNAQGRFELGGLQARNYSIRVLQQPSLLCSISAPVAAGDTNVRLVLDRRQLGTIAGRVVDRHGQGIAGVKVAVSYERVSELLIGRGGSSNADGTFAITAVTTKPAFLRIEGESIVPELFHRLRPDEDVTALTLRVGRRCRIQFEWGAAHGADDQLVVVDARDQALSMMHLTGGSIAEAPYVAYRPGLTDVLAVSDEAAHAIVRRRGQEFARVRLQLAADAVNLIRL